MGKVILYIAASLDGYIAGRDGDVSWLEKYQGGKEDYGYHEFYARIGACIMGAKTYEKALTLEGGIDKKMPTFVVTRRNLKTVPDAKITFYSGDLPALIGHIKTRTEKDIWLVGGGQLAQSFLKEDLLDEMILSIIPVILGDGIPLFGEIDKEVDLELTDSRSYESGIVQTHYRVNHGTEII